MSGTASSIAHVDDLLTQRTVAAIGKFDATIRERIVAEAKKQGHHLKVSDVQSIELLQFVGLAQTVHTRFGAFTSREVAMPTFIDTSDINNNSPSQIERTVHYGESETREFNWSITSGVTVGASVTEKVGVPGLSAELSMSMQMSVSATSG